MPETPSHNLEKALSPESHSRLLNLEKQILILTKGEKIDSNDSSNNESILNSLSDKDKDKLISLLETYDSVLKGETPPIAEGEMPESKEWKAEEKRRELIEWAVKRTNRSPKRAEEWVDSKFSFYEKTEQIIASDLWLTDSVDIMELPDDLVMVGSLHLNGCPNLTKLPDNLLVGEDLYLDRSQDDLIQQAKELKKQGKINGKIVDEKGIIMS